jgi:uncharacterized protein YecE (DUF72 family)
MTQADAGEFRIGTSGYQYDHWVGVLYDEGQPRKSWFDTYAGEFQTVEINNTFYNLPKAETFDDWRERAPAGFRYVLKFSQYGTHMKRLNDPQDTIGVFLEVAERLKSYLGPILVQLPPNMKRDDERLDAFLSAAPRRRRWAVEFRHESWLCQPVYDVLASHNAALCVHDLLEDHPREVTADWVYLRFHGVDYSQTYTPQALTAEARRIKEDLSQGRDVFAFFNNDIGGHAVRDARDLRRYVLG